MPKSTKDDEQKTERFNMFLSPSELQAIEDWAWENRIRSKSEALRRLAAIALTLDRELTGVSEELKKLWHIRELGSDAILAQLNDNPDWQSVAKLALGVISEMVEPHAVLSGKLLAALHQLALLKASTDLRDGLMEVEQLKNESEEKIADLRAAFSAHEEDRK
jgi:hypothetical protein